MDHKLVITPAVDIGVRHSIQDLLKTAGFKVSGGGQMMDGSSSDISFEVPNQHTDKIIDIITDQGCVDKGHVVPTARLNEDLGFDSLDAVELIMALEETFDIEISDDEAEKVTTVQQVIDCVEKL